MPWLFIFNISGLKLKIIRLLINSSGVAFFPRLLLPSLLMTKFINSPFPADESFGITVLSFNKALSFN